MKFQVKTVCNMMFGVFVFVFVVVVVAASAPAAAVFEG